MKILLFTLLIISYSVAKGQDTLDYEMVDAFRLDKKYSTEVLNFLIGKGELTKSEIEEKRLNIFQSVYAIDILDSGKLDDSGIYRFGILQSHGTSYLLLKSTNSIDIISDLEENSLKQNVDHFLNSHAEELGPEMIADYKKALDKWFSNRHF